MKVKRIANISTQEFINEYLILNKPVIVTDGMKDWDREKFTPPYLKEQFGDELVQIYNDLFDLQNVDTLAKYFEENFDQDKKAKEYIRWYTQLKDVDFFWSDNLFSKLKEFWSHPYFVPHNDLSVPFCKKEDSRSITDFQYPYKGIFISGKGARTRLHKDPFNSNALLCQFYGTKKIYLFHPNKENNVMKNNEFVDLINVDHVKFPTFSAIEPDYEDVLQPGEIILFPSGWFHDVTCESDSISVTWNFIHSSGKEGLLNHLRNNPNDDQLEILRYFLKDQVQDEATANQILAFYE
ncbi:cupin-like domain-containing protein [Flavobacterium sp. '19STA2R22 D10 B1']|uniref:cupin-like domain-containing protein n=1 Tax=Flavobacterium aerium TaxID=3037261 RepID=UPI00278C89D9|nr:cupin-like domain-containing protein [Flavobacterium sp. '19STA2R22 D10 B1']